MRDVGRKSAEQEMSGFDQFVRSRLETLTCVYRGVILSCGEYDSSATIKRRSKLAFLWHARGKGFDESCCVHIHADHLRDRGLAIPHDWKFAMQNLDLQAIVNRKAVQTSIDADVTSLRCKLVGAPLHVPAPILERSTGSTIELNGVEVVLCASVTNEEWLVHMGSFDENGELNARNPFQARDLLLKDLTAGNGVQLHRRIRRHLHRGQLRQLQQVHPELFEYVVASARYRAEVIRAERGSRAVQEGDVVMHFEQSPWRWQNAKSEITVYLLWTWHTRGMRRTGLTSIRLDELRGTDDKLPAPDGLGDEDYRLRQGLEEVARAATSRTKAPCKYLGVKLACGNFEPDPSCWPRDFPDGWKSHAVVTFEWQYVTCRDGKPHRIPVRADLAQSRRSLPFDPLHHSSVGAGFYFDVSFMKAVGLNVHRNILYKGIVFDSGDRPELKQHVPNGGKDIHNECVYWALPDGRVECWTLRALISKRDDELFEKHTHEAYLAVAKELGYDVCGRAVCETDLETFRADPGLLSERRWKELEWVQPADESCACWFVANAHEPDRTQPVKLISRSLAILRLELQQSRVASTEKLCKEWERRHHDNKRAVDVLMNNLHLWNHVDGPHPEEDLREPEEVTLLAAKNCCGALARMVDAHGTAQNDLGTYVEEITLAISIIKRLDWESIRIDRFSLTPTELYYALVNNARAHLARHEEEVARKQKRLSALPEMRDEETAAYGANNNEDVQSSGAGYVRLLRKDELASLNGFDIDRDFKGFVTDDGRSRIPRQPVNWERAVTLASEVLLSEMRTLLELHYDDVFVQDWRRTHDGRVEKIPNRKSEYKVFRSVIDQHRRCPNQRISLPPSISNILRSPADENDWVKLERLRCEIEKEIQDEQEVVLTASDLELLAKALERSNSSTTWDVLDDADGRGEPAVGGLPAYSRVLIDDTSTLLPRRLSRKQVEKKRKDIVKKVRSLPDGAHVRVYRRPQRTVRAFKVDSMGEEICCEGTCRKLVQQICEEHEYSKQELLDRMLLVLHDALLLRMSESWTQGDVSNLHVCEINELARWWLAGMSVGSKPLFDAVCAMCGALLHGSQYEDNSLSNKCFVRPFDRDGNSLPLHPDGSARLHVQPPFLLRYSPQLFAKDESAPAWFKHNDNTNRLSLQTGVQPPWIRARLRAGEVKVWCVCTDCHDKHFTASGQRRHPHIPYRDKASQHWLKPIRPWRHVPSGSTPLPSTTRSSEESQAIEQDAEGIEEIGQLHEDADGQPPEDAEADSEHEASVGVSVAGDGRAERVGAFAKRGYVPATFKDGPELRPTLQQYERKWEEKFAKHTRTSPDGFDLDNLAPNPIWQLWQDCPYVPFDDLKSDASQSRLSVCRPHSALEEPTPHGGRYAHVTGETNYRRRAPMQLATTMGFVLNKRSGAFLGLTPTETNAVHDC